LPAVDAQVDAGNEASKRAGKESDCRGNVADAADRERQVGADRPFFNLRSYAEISPAVIVEKSNASVLGVQKKPFIELTHIRGVGRC